MMRSRRSFAMAVLAVLGAAPVLATGGTFTTARGIVVPTPAPEALDCAGMRRVLDAIDASGYRHGGPFPTDAADAALLGYENLLAEFYYMRCVHAPAAVGRTNDAFGGGYSGDVQ